MYFVEKFNQASFLKIVLFQPEIAQNMGTIVRLCACFGVSMDVIEPCGFPFSSKALKRSAMDYADSVSVKTHINFLKYCENKIVKDNKSRVILMTTKGTQSLWDFSFNKHDHLFFGSEGSGVPPSVAENVDAKIFIPMQGGGRSLNLAVSAGIALAEATRQLI
mgnify:CR=1 FL=1|jgi:tRNA (cytidine/uridine-2'-O-)-methyltransferase